MFPFTRSRAASRPPLPLNGQVFPYPIPNCPRIALFSDRFVAVHPITLASEVSELTSLNVQSVAASMQTIRSIDPRVWNPEYPIVVLSEQDCDLLSATDRDYIWNTFGVPVFEYLLAASGRIIARECEAHDGMHVEGDVGPGFAITDELCACGRSGSRVLAHAALATRNAII